MGFYVLAWIAYEGSQPTKGVSLCVLFETVGPKSNSASLKAFLGYETSQERRPEEHKSIRSCYLRIVPKGSRMSLSSTDFYL